MWISQQSFDKEYNFHVTKTMHFLEGFSWENLSFWKFSKNIRTFFTNFMTDKHHRKMITWMIKLKITNRAQSTLWDPLRYITKSLFPSKKRLHNHHVISTHASAPHNHHLSTSIDKIRARRKIGQGWKHASQFAGLEIRSRKPRLYKMFTRYLSIQNADIIRSQCSKVVVADIRAGNGADVAEK